MKIISKVDSGNTLIEFFELESVRSSSDTLYKTARAAVRCEDKLSGEVIQFPVDLLKVPVLTETGYKINGKSKQFVGNYTLSPGWYIQKDKDYEILKLNPQGSKDFKGGGLTIFMKDHLLYVSRAGCVLSKSVKLPIFLKALTGSSFAELSSLIGRESVYITRSFRGEEPSRADCITETLHTLYPSMVGTSIKEYRLRMEGMELNLNKLMSNVLGDRIALGAVTGKRMIRSMSFSHRCSNMYLGQDLKTKTLDLKRGTFLDTFTLASIDHSDVETLVVEDSEHKVYVVRKRDSYSFRALGEELAEDITLGKVVFEKGTILTEAILESLNNSEVPTIRVRYGNSSREISRRVFNGRLLISDVLGMIQVYTNHLDGIDLQDDKYVLSNQNLITLDSIVRDTIQYNCLKISYAIINGTDSQSMTLLERVLNLKIDPRAPSNENSIALDIDSDEILSLIKSSDSRESQQAGLNNIVQRKAEEYRVAKSVMRSSADLIQVQQSQFGRIDMVESPESSKVGKVQARTFESRMDELGFIQAPFMRVENGKVIGTEPVYLTSEQQGNSFFADWNETFHTLDENGNQVKKKTVLAISNEEMLEVAVDQVKYKLVGPYSTMSIARMQAPFPGNMNLKRGLMQANHVKQVHVPFNNERSLVSSGGGSFLVEENIIRAEKIVQINCEQLDLNISHDTELILTGVDTRDGYKRLTFGVTDYPELSFHHNVPHIVKSSSGGLFSYFVNTTKGLSFKGRDIVAYNYNIDIRDYDIVHNTDFGHMKVDDRIFENSAALATNLVVGFKTHESCTIDDSVTISGRLIGVNKMTTIYLQSISYTLSEKIDSVADLKEVQVFFNAKHSSLNSDGTPKIGTRIKPRDPIIGYKTITSSISNKKEVQRPELSSFVFAEDNEQGVVVSVKRFMKEDKETVEVVLAQLREIDQGDKIAGLCGNKGVIAKVLPEEMMPYDPVTGRSIDIFISPLGVPSRSNISQILENNLAMSMDILNKLCIITPFKEGSYEFVKDMAKIAGNSPRVLIDPRTGRAFDRPINMGMMYILKLEHMGAPKLKAIGLESKLDPTFGQPSKGSGGQAIGEYETWVLGAVGATKTQQDFFSVLSDDIPATKRLADALLSDEEINIQGENKNDEVLQILVRSLGGYLTYDAGGNLMIRPITDEMIRSLNRSPVDPQNKSSLTDRKIFGSNNNAAERFENRNLWSWLDLGCEIVHPLYIIKGGLNKYILITPMILKGGNLETGNVEQLNTVQMEKILTGNAYIRIEDEGSPPVYYDSSVLTGIVGDSVRAEGETGMSALVHLLRISDPEDVLSYLENSLLKTKTTKTRFLKLKEIGEIQSFCSTGIKLSEFIIRSFPIIPLAFRPTPKFDHISQDFDFYYGRIMDAVSDIKTSRDASNSRIRTLFLRIAEFCGLKYGGLTETNKAYKPLLKFFTHRENPDSKHGHLRESMAKKRIFQSGRGVITPSSDMKRPPIKVGIPYRMCLELWGSRIVKYLMEAVSSELTPGKWKYLLSLVATNPIRFSKEINYLVLEGDLPELEGNEHLPVHRQYSDLILKVSRDYIEGVKDYTGNWIRHPRVVVLGRQPSLHEFSMQGLIPVITFGNTIEIHPLICEGYNADFDGDQMWLAALMNEESCREILMKLSSYERVINNKDGKLIISHSQDIRLGIYHATMLKDNVVSLDKSEYYSKIAPMYYNNLVTLKMDLETRSINTYDLVIFETKGNKYFSTAGRVLYNGLIPKHQGFTDNPFSNQLNIPNLTPTLYKELRFDGLISKTSKGAGPLKYISQSDISLWSYETFDPYENMNFYQSLSEFGFMFCDLSGASLTLEDFIEDPKQEELVKRTSEHAQKINDWYIRGVLSEEDRKRELIELYDYMQSYATSQLMSAFDRNNNLFIMFDSGARGSKGQVMHACGMIGILEKSKGEALEVPILGNYTKGLSSMETMLASFSARLGVASTQNETSNSGQLTREAVYMSAGFRIVEHDCGAEPYSMHLGFSGTGYASLGKEQGLPIDHLVGAKILEEDSNSYPLRHLKNFLDSEGRITPKCVPLIEKKRILKVKTDRGEYVMKFKISGFTESILFNRYAEGLPHLKSPKGSSAEGNYISTKTLKELSSLGVPTVKVRNLFGCKSVGGCCAICYGLKYNNNKLPEVGEYIGITSAQSIGEPATQLTMNLFHKGGAAGESIDQGVALYKKLLHGGIPSNFYRTTINSEEGYVTAVTPEFIHLSTGKREFISTSPEVQVGEFVEKYEALSVGEYAVDGFSENPEFELVRKLQLALTEFHYRVFESSDIEVFARHFELFVRVQTSFVTVSESDNPDRFPVGSRHPLAEIMKEGENIKYFFEVNKSNAVISDSSGIVTLLTHEAFAENMNKLVVTGTRNSATSWVGDLVEGQFLTGPRKIHKSLGIVEVERKERDIKTNERVLQDIIGKSKVLPISTAPDIQVLDTSSLDDLLDLGSTEDISIEEVSEKPSTPAQKSVSNMSLF